MVTGAGQSHDRSWHPLGLLRMRRGALTLFLLWYRFRYATITAEGTSTTVPSTRAASKSATVAGAALAALAVSTTHQEAVPRWKPLAFGLRLGKYQTVGPR